MLGPMLCAMAMMIPSPINDSEVVLSRIKTKIESLLAKPQPDLFARHLRSVLALSEEEVLRLRFAPDAEKVGKEVLGYLTTIETGLNDDGDKADTYLVNGRRALILARASGLDGSIQWATVSLPAHWDPNRAYPLHVGLHGFGPSVPLAYVNFTFMPHGANDKPAGDVISIGPWGRGNRQWLNDSEADIWEAIADVQKFAKLDPERWYLSGHSMGADGTWSLVQRTPDKWAAAALMAGSTFAAPPRLGLVPNAAYVPFYIWVGDQDTGGGRIPSSQEARDAIVALGGTAKFVLAKGVGHMTRGQDEEAKLDWLMTHKRKRPNHFMFVVDTLRHRGVWGVSVPQKYESWYPMPEPNVRFEVTIEAGKVQIETRDAEKLLVDFGATGLGLTGDVELFVNGKSRFKGGVPASPLEVNVGA